MKKENRCERAAGDAANCVIELIQDIKGLRCQLNLLPSIGNNGLSQVKSSINIK